MWGIWAIRSPNSVMGYAAAWLKENGSVREFDTQDEAETEAKRLNNEVRSPNVTYFAQEM